MRPAAFYLKGMAPFCRVDPSAPENYFLWREPTLSLQLALSLAASAGLVISAGVLPAGAWFQAGAAIVCAIVSAITVWNALHQRCVKQSAFMLVIMSDGSAVTRDDSVSPVTETLLLLRFAWRGERSARLVFVTPDGRERHWRLYRRDLNASQWHCLCRWILWLERGQKPA